MRQITRSLSALAFASLASLTHTLAWASTGYEIIYADEGTDTGFYDPTVVAPVGGNTGTTRGEQRRIAFEYAVNVWASVVSSDIPITIEATMAALECDMYSAVLGQAAPNAAVELTLAEGPGSGQPHYYVIALGNALDGEDLDPPSLIGSGADIYAEFNGALDDSTCLGSLSWYMGLDGNPGDDTDFVGVVLHELAHGLGFLTLIDPETGEAFGDSSDIFATMALDLDRDTTWSEMNASEALQSFKNARRVVWTGAHVTASASKFLVPGTPRITVNPEIAGLRGVLSEQDLGPKVADHPATARLVVAEPRSGCEELSNADDLEGAIALVFPDEDRCYSIEAAMNLEEAGAIAVITADPSERQPPTPILGEFPGQAAPVVSIHLDDAELLAAAAARGATVTLDGDSSRLLGTDATAQLYLYATDPIELGSTSSHWDTSARNQLLMEPTSSAAFLDVDITRAFMRDIGWPACGDSTLQGTEECDDGNDNDLDGCSAQCTEERCGDGVVNQPGEECDDGNTSTNDGCDPTCRLETSCGNGRVDAGEDCDDGNTTSDDGCSRTCTSEPVCGNGAVEEGEDCDDGNTRSDDGCNALCQREAVGYLGSLPLPGGSAGSGGEAGEPTVDFNSHLDNATDQDKTSGCDCRAAGGRAPSSAWTVLGLFTTASLMNRRFRRHRHHAQRRA